MMIRLKSLYRWIREKIWFYPSLFSFFAIILAVIVIFYDMQPMGQKPVDIPSFFLTSLEMGDSILGIIAGAFITITTFTFSTTMVVLTMYTSQYTPRVIKNFLAQKETLQSFGVFVSGFLYAMIALLFLSNYDEGTEVFSATVGILYILIGLVFFFRFISNVSSYIQTGSLLGRLKDNAYKSIEQYKKSIEGKEVLTDIAMGKIKAGTTFAAEKDGYFQEIDYDKTIKIAEDYNVDIFFLKVTGQFVTKNTIIGSFLETKAPLSKKQQQELLQVLHNSIFIGKERTEAQDFDYSIQKVVEVGIRALSPGINDPYTAIQCIQILSLMLREISSLPKGHLVMRESEEKNPQAMEKAMVCKEAIDFEVLLVKTFQQLVHYGKEDMMVIKEIIKALQVIDENANSHNHKLILDFGNYISRKIEKSNYDKEELKGITSEVHELKG